MLSRVGTMQHCFTQTGVQQQDPMATLVPNACGTTLSEIHRHALLMSHSSVLSMLLEFRQETEYILERNQDQKVKLDIQ